MFSDYENNARVLVNLHGLCERGWSLLWIMSLQAKYTHYSKLHSFQLQNGHYETETRTNYIPRVVFNLRCPLYECYLDYTSFAVCWKYHVYCAVWFCVVFIGIRFPGRPLYWCKTTHDYYRYISLNVQCRRKAFHWYNFYYKLLSYVWQMTMAKYRLTIQSKYPKVQSIK